MFCFVAMLVKSVWEGIPNVLFCCNACRKETCIVTITGNMFDEFARLVNLEELKMYRNKVNNMNIASLKGRLPGDTSKKIENT
jgi:hypothetical protein